jgi:hypothetical protein
MLGHGREPFPQIKGVLAFEIITIRGSNRNRSGELSTDLAAAYLQSWVRK